MTLPAKIRILLMAAGLIAGLAVGEVPPSSTFRVKSERGIRSRTHRDQAVAKEGSSGQSATPAQMGKDYSELDPTTRDALDDVFSNGRSLATPESQQELIRKLSERKQPVEDVYQLQEFALRYEVAKNVLGTYRLEDQAEAAEAFDFATSKVTLGALLERITKLETARAKASQIGLGRNLLRAEENTGASQPSSFYQDQYNLLTKELDKRRKEWNAAGRPGITAEYLGFKTKFETQAVPFNDIDFEHYFFAFKLADSFGQILPPGHRLTLEKFQAIEAEQKLKIFDRPRYLSDLLNLYEKNKLTPSDLDFISDYQALLTPGSPGDLTLLLSQARMPEKDRDPFFRKPPTEQSTGEFLAKRKFYGGILPLPAAPGKTKDSSTYPLAINSPDPDLALKVLARLLQSKLPLEEVYGLLSTENPLKSFETTMEAYRFAGSLENGLALSEQDALDVAVALARSPNPRNALGDLKRAARRAFQTAPDGSSLEKEIRDLLEPLEQWDQQFQGVAFYPRAVLAKSELRPQKTRERASPSDAIESAALKALEQEELAMALEARGKSGRERADFLRSHFGGGWSDVTEFFGTLSANELPEYLAFAKALAAAGFPWDAVGAYLREIRTSQKPVPLLDVAKFAATVDGVSKQVGLSGDMGKRLAAGIFLSGAAKPNYSEVKTALEQALVPLDKEARVVDALRDQEGLARYPRVFSLFEGAGHSRDLREEVVRKYEDRVKKEVEWALQTRNLSPWRLQGEVESRLSLEKSKLTSRRLKKLRESLLGLSGQELEKKVTRMMQELSAERDPKFLARHSLLAADDPKRAVLEAILLRELLPYFPTDPTPAFSLAQQLGRGEVDSALTALDALIYAQQRLKLPPDGSARFVEKIMEAATPSEALEKHRASLNLAPLTLGKTPWAEAAKAFDDADTMSGMPEGTTANLAKQGKLGTEGFPSAVAAPPVVANSTPPSSDLGEKPKIPAPSPEPNSANWAHRGAVLGGAVVAAELVRRYSGWGKSSKSCEANYLALQRPRRDLHRDERSVGQSERVVEDEEALFFAEVDTHRPTEAAEDLMPKLQQGHAAEILAPLPMRKRKGNKAALSLEDVLALRPKERSAALRVLYREHPELLAAHLATPNPGIKPAVLEAYGLKNHPGAERLLGLPNLKADTALKLMELAGRGVERNSRTFREALSLVPQEDRVELARALMAPLEAAKFGVFSDAALEVLYSSDPSLLKAHLEFASEKIQERIAKNFSIPVDQLVFLGSFRGGTAKSFHRLLSASRDAFERGTKEGIETVLRLTEPENVLTILNFENSHGDSLKAVLGKMPSSDQHQILDKVFGKDPRKLVKVIESKSKYFPDVLARAYSVSDTEALQRLLSIPSSSPHQLLTRMRNASRAFKLNPAEIETLLTTVSQADRSRLAEVLAGATDKSFSNSFALGKQLLHGFHQKSREMRQFVVDVASHVPESYAGGDVARAIAKAAKFSGFADETEPSGISRWLRSNETDSGAKAALLRLCHRLSIVQETDLDTIIPKDQRRDVIAKLGEASVPMAAFADWSGEEGKVGRIKELLDNSFQTLGRDSEGWLVEVAVAPVSWGLLSASEGTVRVPSSGDSKDSPIVHRYERQRLLGQLNKFDDQWDYRRLTAAEWELLQKNEDPADAYAKVNRKAAEAVALRENPDEIIPRDAAGPLRLVRMRK